MDLRAYTGFVAAAEAMNITLAAQRLNLTQSALSRQIKALEDSLGVALFEKAGRNVRLTSAGQALFSRVNAVLIADRTLRTFADDIAKNQTGLLKIGFCSQLIERFLPNFLPQWRAANPDIDIHIEDGGGPELGEKLRAGDLHLILSAMPAAPVAQFEALPLGKLGFLAVATAEHLPPSPRPVEIADLMELPILTLNRRHASREVFDAACRLLGAVPQVVLESSAPSTLFAMAAGGNGVAVVPSSAMVPAVAQGSAQGGASRALVARAIALRGTPIEFAIGAMWNSRAPLPLYGRRFLTDIAAHIGQVEAASQTQATLRIA